MARRGDNSSGTGGDNALGESSLVAKQLPYVQLCLWDAIVLNWGKVQEKD